VAPETADAVLDLAKRRGFAGVRRVGGMVAGAPGVKMLDLS
jgi:hypothetical protein